MPGKNMISYDTGNLPQEVRQLACFIKAIMTMIDGFEMDNLFG